MNFSVKPNRHIADWQHFSPAWQGLYRPPMSDENWCGVEVYDIEPGVFPRYDGYSKSEDCNVGRENRAYSPQYTIQTNDVPARPECLVYGDRMVEAHAGYQRWYPEQGFRRHESQDPGFLTEDTQFNGAEALQFQNALWDSLSREVCGERWGAFKDDAFFDLAAKPHAALQPSHAEIGSLDLPQDTETTRVKQEPEHEPQESRESVSELQAETSPTLTQAKATGPMKRFRNLRKVANRPEASPFELTPSKVYMHTMLEIVGAHIEDINRVPWDPLELSDGRRIVRVEARQYGPLIRATFRALGSALQHPTPEPAPPGVDVTEVSCLQYVSVKDGVARSYYYITSVELVNIIDTLINIKVMDAHLRRREKGRIRSNLSPYWSKNSLGSTKSIEEQDSTDPRTHFARRISNYGIRKPRCLDKDVRVLSWSKLVPAIQRAIQCYYTEIPAEEVASYESSA